ncbi:MAG: ATPase, T2SS/T4P/T4SS family [Candidatus Rifleibacteriota bacterium]
MPISTNDLEKFSRKFGKMLGSGVPLLKTLSLIEKEDAQSELGQILSKVSSRIKEGFTFSSSLEMFPGVFTEVYVAMVKAAESQGRLDHAMVEIADSISQGVIEAGSGSSECIEPAAESEDQNLKVIKFVNVLMTDAFRQKAAMVSMNPEADKVSINLGDSLNLKCRETISKDFYDRVLARIKLMSCLDMSERQLPQDGRILVKIDEDQVDIRTQILPTVFGEQMLMFFINKKNACVDPEKVFPDADDRQKIAALLKNLGHGLVVFSGPTGSGKTTTMYAAASIFNPDQNKSVVAVSNQVYYTYEGVSHVKTRPWIGLNMLSATRAVIRAEPALMILESLSDEQTAQETFAAAGEGMVVFTQMSAKNPADVFKQFLNLKVSSHLLYGGMGAVVFQVLVRKVCPHCRKEVEVSDEKIQSMGLTGLTAGKFSESTGCEKCNNTGYIGRLPLYEMIVPDKNLKDLIIRGNPREISEEIERLQSGYFVKKLFALATEGKTTLSEVKRIQEILA